MYIGSDVQGTVPAVTTLLVPPVLLRRLLYFHTSAHLTTCRTRPVIDGGELSSQAQVPTIRSADSSARHQCSYIVEKLSSRGQADSVQLAT